MSRSVPGLALLLCLAASVLPASSKVESLALFIGVDEGLDQDRDLKYAARDAARMAEVFRELGTYDRDRIYLLCNPTFFKVRSTLEEMRGRVKELRKRGAQTSALLYYSGHGSADGLHIRGRRLDRQEVNALVESLESDLKIVILDACESGDFLRRKGGTVLEDRRIEKHDRLKSQGTIVISSSSRGEAAQESEDYRGAVFSHHFVNGLRGLADYDVDGQVSLLEVFDYARASTRMEEIRGQAGRQNPSFDFDVVGESDPVLSRLERVRSRVLLRRMPAAALEIYDVSTQEMVQRVWMTARDSAYFYLPSGKFVLRYAEGGAWRVKTVDLTWTPEVAVGPKDFRKQGRTLLARKGPVGSLVDPLGFQLQARSVSPVFDQPLFGVGYVLRAFGAKAAIGFAIGREPGVDIGSERVAETSVYRTGLSLRKSLYAARFFQLQTGADFAYHRVLQEVRDRRFDGEDIITPFGPVPTRWSAASNVLEAGVPLEVELYFPGRMWLGLSAGASLYRLREGADGVRGWRNAVEPGLSLGRQF